MKLELDMIENVLEIKDTHVREVMTSLIDALAIDAGATLLDFHKFWVTHLYSRVPVFEQRIDNIVGISYAMDLLDFMQKIQAIVKKYDILFIADEVICAFGRLGTMFGCDKYNIKPDLVSIAKFFAACKNHPVFCIITEYLVGGSLRKYLHQQEPYSLPLNLVLKFAIDIKRGMQYLHSQGIIHRDLKSENLLLGEDMCVKVANFGISCLESQCGSPKGFTGTYRWMAPEMIKEKAHTKKVDVYNFDIVLWELLTALTPFDNMTPEQVAFAVFQKGIPGISPFPDEYNPATWMLENSTPAAEERIGRDFATTNVSNFLRFLDSSWL